MGKCEKHFYPYFSMKIIFFPALNKSENRNEILPNQYLQW